MKTIVLASSNPGKVREFNALLADIDFEVIPQSYFQLTAIEETGLSFVENAILKARHAAKHTGLPTLADDSGLEVEALNGAPGIYSARFGGEGATDVQNCALLLEKLKATPDECRDARFYCVLVYLRHALDPAPLICEGSWQGVILHAPQGENGFGYDPVFYVPTHHCSAAQLPLEMKNALSHRGQALRALHQVLASVRA